MREPFATQVVSAIALVLMAGALIAAYILIYRYAMPGDIMIAVWAALLFFCAFLVPFFMARMEYGEWMKGKPWWDRSPPQPPDLPPG